MRKFDPLFTPEGAKNISPQAHVDFRVFGAVPLEIYLQTKDPRFLDLGRSFADRQWETTTPDGITAEARYWIDDMFMITAVQIQAYRATGDTKYLDRAARAMVAYLDKLQQPNGLFFHAPDSRSTGAAATGGWRPARRSCCARCRRSIRGAPESSRATAHDGVAAQIQGEDGLWRQLLEIRGVAGNLGHGDVHVRDGHRREERLAGRQDYGPAARKAWLGLVKYIDETGNIREVCAGTHKGDTVEYYLDRPRNTGDLHGQAPMLWTASALLR